MEGVFPHLERDPPHVPSQGRTIAGAIVREPASLRTGRALTGAVRRIIGSQGENTPKAAVPAAFAILEAGWPAGNASSPPAPRRQPAAGRTAWKCVSI